MKWCCGFGMSKGAKQAKIAVRIVADVQFRVYIMFD